MKKRDYALSIAIPASLVSDVPHLREKTMKVSLVGRAAAIFCVNEIVVFPDLPDINQRRDTDLLVTILSYMETPQYLRKRFFKIKPALRYAGILPPLRTPHHPLANRTKDLAIGEYRDGAVLSSSDAGSLLDIGVDRPVLIPNTKLPSNTRVTAKVTKLGKHPRATLASSDEVEEYWGYHVTVSEFPFGQLVRFRSFDLVIATSRHGIPLMKAAYELTKRWQKSRRILVAFGAPTQGLNEIVAHEHLELDEVVTFAVNTIPNQGTETVRTEEALYASLGILKLIVGE
jgi:predicted SPOUT superfamily RNA methylase MTH1